MTESPHQLDLKSQEGQERVNCCIPIGCLNSTFTHHDPTATLNADQKAAHQCWCNAGLFLLEFIILVLEGVVAFAEFHERKVEQRERNCPSPAPTPAPNGLFHWLKDNKLSLLINVLSAALLGLLIYKYVKREKEEGAHQKYFLCMYWRNSTTQRYSKLYGSALQLLDLVFVVAHLGISLRDTVALLGVKIPRLGAFSVFPLLLADFEACVRLISLISHWWSSHFCYVYCPHRNPSPPQPQGEQPQQQQAQQQSQPQGEQPQQQVQSQGEQPH